MKGRQLTQRLISALVLALFMMFQAGTHAFMHLHTIDGVTVAHSHPYTGASHTHTAQQMLSLAAASHFVSGEPAYCSPDFSPARTVRLLYTACTTCSGHTAAPGMESLPSPPVACMI